MIVITVWWGAYIYAHKHTHTHSQITKRTIQNWQEANSIVFDDIHLGILIAFRWILQWNGPENVYVLLSVAVVVVTCFNASFRLHRYLCCVYHEPISYSHTADHRPSFGGEISSVFSFLNHVCRILVQFLCSAVYTHNDISSICIGRIHCIHTLSIALNVRAKNTFIRTSEAQVKDMPFMLGFKRVNISP